MGLIDKFKKKENTSNCMQFDDEFKNIQYFSVDG